MSEDLRFRLPADPPEIDYDAIGALLAEKGIGGRPPVDQLPEALIPIAARVLRLDGGCESGHKPGQWHMHEEPYHRLGQQLAALARGASPAAPRPEGLDVEALATALERTYQGSHPSSARRDDWVSDASFVADEYAAAILARLSDTGDTP